MRSSILRKLGFAPDPVSSEDMGLLESIERRLVELDPRRARLIAAFAGLLARVAYADEAITDAEAERIGDLVAERSSLSREEAETVALLARRKTVALGGAEDHLLTRHFNEVASEEDKRRLIECLYAVATADGLVSHVEDREVRRIGSALMLPPSEILEIRSRHRDKLEELQLLRQVRERSK